MDLNRIATLLAGTDFKIRRMIGYWAGTCLFYLSAIGLLWIQASNGDVSLRHAQVLTVVGVGGMAFFYAMLRLSSRLGIVPWKLAIVQALYAIACNIILYSITGPVRCGRIATPVASLMFVVTAAMYDSQVNESGIAMSSGPPIFPLGAYG